MSLLRKIEKSLDGRLRSIFSGGNSSAEPEGREAIELYRDAMEQVSQRAQVGRKGERIFPFNVITVELHADTPERRAMLEALFDAEQLKEDIRATLHEERVQLPGDLEVRLHYNAEAVVEMRVLCEKQADPAPAAAIEAVPNAPKPARLIAVNGAASEPEYVPSSSRVNLGRDPDVTDNMGRLIRRNELHFPEALHEANGSVSRSHAHLAADPDSGDWRIFDDGSSLGTSLFRDGHRVEIPAHGPRGVLLRNGDEIYIGQVRLRFETTCHKIKANAHLRVPLRFLRR